MVLSHFCVKLNHTPKVHLFPHYYNHIVMITAIFFKVKGLKINLPTHSLCERELGIAWHYQKKERREDILTSKSCARI